MQRLSFGVSRVTSQEEVTVSDSAAGRMSYAERLEVLPVPKLERAYELYNHLDQRAQEIIDTETEYRAELYGLKPDQSDVLFWVRVPGEHPEMGVIAGEAVHDVRSSLDHLVTELRDEHGLARSRTSQFAIYSNEGDWDAVIAMPEERGGTCEACGRPPRRANPLEGLGANQLEHIKTRQPFSPGPSGEALKILAKASNVDKHRSLHVCGVRLHNPNKVAYEPEGYYEVASSSFSVGKDILEQGVEFGRIQRRTITDPPLGLNVQVRVGGAAELAFFVDSDSPVFTLRDLNSLINVAYDIYLAMSPRSPRRTVGMD